jgi:hypothetical protein
MHHNKVSPIIQPQIRMRLLASAVIVAFHTLGKQIGRANFAYRLYG